MKLALVKPSTSLLDLAIFILISDGRLSTIHTSKEQQNEKPELLIV